MKKSFILAANLFTQKFKNLLGLTNAKLAEKRVNFIVFAERERNTSFFTMN